MLNFVQKFLENTANFFFGRQIKQQEEAYEQLLSAMDRSPKQEPDEVHTVTIEQLRQVKREFFSKALQGGIATVYLDPRIPGVRVPEKLKGQELLVLNYSYRYHIADFNFDEKCIVASLSFSGYPYQCVVPWDAVMGIGNKAEDVFYSFVQQMPGMDLEQKSLHSVESEKAVFDEASHERALERRSQFKVIKGEKE
jgi:hypothetical protein